MIMHSDPLDDHDINAISCISIVHFMHLFLKIESEIHFIIIEND